MLLKMKFLCLGLMIFSGNWIEVLNKWGLIEFLENMNKTFLNQKKQELWNKIGFRFSKNSY